MGLSSMKNTFKQFIIYSIIGIIGTTGHYIVLIILVELFGSNPVIATTFGFVVGAMINYILNYNFTFRSKKSHSEAAVKFLIVATVGAGVNSLIMYLGTEFLILHYIIAQVIATVLVLLWSFIVNKYWTFLAKEIST